MSELNREDITEEVAEELRTKATGLKEALDQGNISDAMQRIAELGEVRDRSLYREVGRLTRSLHEALRNFEIKAENNEQQEELSKMADASDRLDYVVKLTGRSANKTMDLVEDTMPLASNLREEAGAIREDWGRLRRREMKPSEFRELYGRIDGFLDRIASDSDRLNNNLSEILLAQDFQDLTGQVIQRVTSLVKEVEDHLVRLMVMASDVDKIAGVVHDYGDKGQDGEVSSKGEGPQIDNSQQDVVSGQDEVDDLLSSLGF
ncbi:MAG: protein phosphatase CheZ [Pseudomonadota bacterium]